MTTKYDNFVTALHNLCYEHDVCLAVSAYEGLVIYDIDSKYLNDVLDVSGIEDCTNEN